MAKKKVRFSVKEQLQSMDLYGRRLPSFTMHGRESVHTYCGSLTSIGVYIILLLFAAIKLNHLMSKHNPNIAQILQKNFFTEDDHFVPVEENFNLAFSLEDYLTGETKNDPRYVKTFARIASAVDGEDVTYEVPFHQCTDDDYASFMPPNKAARGGLEARKNDPKRGLWCFDWDGIEFFGTERTKSNARLEILFLPCNHRLTHLGGKEDRIDPECIADLSEQIAYLGPLNMILYYNQQRFLQEEYGERAIENFSELLNIQTDEYRPNWVYSSVQTNMLSDETELVQYGISAEDYFNEFKHAGAAYPSSWTKYPTDENPHTKYKFTSIEINFSQDQLIINRQTYNILEWLGDIGGLKDALFPLGLLLVYPVAEFAKDSALLGSLFKFRPSQTKLSQSIDYLYQKADGKSKKKLKEKIVYDFKNLKKITLLSFFRYFCSKQTKYKKWLRKIEGVIDKELDFAKFIHFKRITKTATVALLTASQKKFADRFSQLVIRESSDLDNTSMDDELSANGELDQGTQAVNFLINSNDKIDRSLIDIYKVRKARELVHFGEMEGIVNRCSNTLASDLIFQRGLQQASPNSEEPQGKDLQPVKKTPVKLAPLKLFQRAKHEGEEKIRRKRQDLEMQQQNQFRLPPIFGHRVSTEIVTGTDGIKKVNKVFQDNDDYNDMSVDTKTADQPMHEGSSSFSLMQRNPLGKRRQKLSIPLTADNQGANSRNLSITHTEFENEESKDQQLSVNVTVNTEFKVYADPKEEENGTGEDNAPIFKQDKHS